MSAFAALFSALALYITYLGTGEGKWSVYFAAAFCLCIAGWQTSNFIVGLQLRQRLKKGRTATGRRIEIEEDTVQPSLNSANTSQFVKAQSVTESTTELLEPLPRGESKK